MRTEERLQQSEGRNRCNPIDILWEYFCTAGGIYKGNLRRIERNRRLMPSRRFLAADLDAHLRCSRGNRSVSATICLVSMIAPRLPGIVTFRFRELLPPLHQLSHAKGCDLEPYSDLNKIASELLRFLKKWDGGLLLSIDGDARNHAFELIF